MRSLGKALELLELLNRSRVPMTLQALSQASGYPKSTIHSLLATLRSYGCIRQEPDGRYYLGTKLFEWGCGVSAAWEITRCARPHLERLAQQTQYTALLSCVEGSNIVVIDQRVSGNGDPGGLGDRRPYAPSRHVAGEAAAVPAAGCHGALSDERSAAWIPLPPIPS